MQTEQVSQKGGWIWLAITTKLQFNFTGPEVIRVEKSGGALLVPIRGGANACFGCGWSVWVRFAFILLPAICC